MFDWVQNRPLTDFIRHETTWREARKLPLINSRAKTMIEEKLKLINSWYTLDMDT